MLAGNVVVANMVRTNSGGKEYPYKRYDLTIVQEVVEAIPWARRDRRCHRRAQEHRTSASRFSLAEDYVREKTSRGDLPAGWFRQGQMGTTGRRYADMDDEGLQRRDDRPFERPDTFEPCPDDLPRVQWAPLKKLHQRLAHPPAETLIIWRGAEARV